MLFSRKYENARWGGLTKFVPELIAIKIGIKPAMRIPVDAKFPFDSFKRLCNHFGLQMGLSDFKIMPPYTKKDILPPASKQEGHRFLYATISECILERVKECELKDELLYGKLMGYPSCCINSYMERMRTGPSEYDIYNYLKSGKRLSWYNNIFLRFCSNYYLLDYFPCSFDCQPSVNFAKKLLKGIREEDSLYAKKIEYHLKLPILYGDVRKGGILYNWDNLKGVVFNGSIRCNEILYSDFFSLNTRHHYFEFKAGNRIKVSGTDIRIFKNDVMIKRINKKNERDGIAFRFK